MNAANRSSHLEEPAGRLVDYDSEHYGDEDEKRKKSASKTMRCVLRTKYIQSAVTGHETNSADFAERCRKYCELFPNTVMSMLTKNPFCCICLSHPT